MFALLKDVPVVNSPVFRIALGVALVAAGLAVHQIVIAAVGGLILVMGIIAGVSALTGHTQKG
jgi:hypothetical protein